MMFDSRETLGDESLHSKFVHSDARRIFSYFNK